MTATCSSSSRVEQLMTLSLSDRNMDDMLSPLGGLELPMHDPMTPDGVQATGSAALKRKYTKSEHYKQRRRHDRFNGMSEDEVRLRTLPDHLTTNLDVVIVSQEFVLTLDPLPPPQPPGRARSRPLTSADGAVAFGNGGRVLS